MNKEILATSLMLVFAGLSGAADAPTAEIANEELRAKIYLPDAKDGFYKGTRFDWSGVIFSLQYKGHEFYGPWFTKTDPNTRDFVYDCNDIIAGPCSAITGPVDEFKPIGFERAKSGETFIKIGVGALRKGSDNKYDNYFMYPVADGGKWTLRKGRDYAEFTQQLVRLLHHCRMVGGGDLGAHRARHDGADLLDHVEHRPARLHDQGRVGRHPVEQARGRQILDVGNVGGIDEELHINYPNGQWYGRARHHNF
jgi:hypothetical protein